jgi:lipopolysaccharide transport system ATP-binding protein
MKHSEIKNKFDEIVHFSEIEKFLDEPVKRFSSGMYVRLAFSVAAHLEPDILIVDEVLAVGDSAFQKKCLGKMEDVATQRERTILFVSHDMGAVTSLCKRGIWLSDGKINCDCDIESTTSRYLTHGTSFSGKVSISKSHQYQPFCFKHISLENSKNEICSTFDVRESITINISYSTQKFFDNLELSARVYNSTGIPVFTVNRSASNSHRLPAGNYLAKIKIPSQFLVPGAYTIDIGAHIPLVETITHHQSILSFEIEETGSIMRLYKGSQFGIILVDFDWKEINKVEKNEFH